MFDPVKVKSSADGRLVVRSPFSFRKDFVMGDGVELSPDGRRFRLLGRRDRIVKVSEQRVSLPELESRMKELDGIADVAIVLLEGEKGPFLGAVIVPSRHDGPLPSGGGKESLAIRRMLLPVFPKGAVPRRYRFVRELPHNAQGKVQVDVLRGLFADRHVP